MTGIRSSFVGRVTAVSGWAGWAGWAGSEVAPGCRSARPDRQGRKQRTHAHTMSMTLGAAKCVPPLLAWLRRARIALAAPGRSAGDEAVADFDADMGDSASAASASTRRAPWKRPCPTDEEEAAKKKRLREALFCSERDRAAGARWAGVAAPALGPGTVPVRVEAAIGDAFFVFRVCEFSTALHERRGEEVLALPASDFKIEWLREKRGEWIGEVLERRLCKRRGAEIDSGDSDSD